MKEMHDIPLDSSGVLRSPAEDPRQSAWPSSISSTENGIRGCCCPDVPSPQAQANNNSAAGLQHNEQTQKAQQQKNTSIDSRVADGRRSSVQSSRDIEVSSGHAEQQAETTFPASQQDRQTNNAETNLDHECRCGDACSCFGCPTHPKNKSTTAYVRYCSSIGIDDEMSSVSSTNEKSQPPRSQWSIEVTPRHSNQWSHSTADLAEAQNLAYRHLVPQPQNGMQKPTAQIPFSIHDSAPSLLSTELNSDEQDPESMAFDIDSPTSDETASNMLDPMSFFVHQYTFSPCNDSTGTPHCDNGCSCLGCLTHNSHSSSPPFMAQIQPTFAGQMDHETAGQNQSHALADSMNRFSDCACDYHPTIAVRAENSQQPLRSTTSLPRNTTDIQTPVVSSHISPAPGLGIICNATCTCSGGNKMLAIAIAQAQVQVHAQLHGRDCDCRMGRQYFQTLTQAEAATYQHPSSRSAVLSSAPSWG